MLSTATPTAAICEIWSPNHDRSQLEFSSGSYGEFTALEHVSETSAFAMGEGLPGVVWASREPVLLEQLKLANFVRFESAHAAGLTAGIGLPFVIGDEVRSVLTLLADRDRMRFACEMWRPDERRSRLFRRSGIYGRGCGFGDITAIPSFAYGQGLPGRVWKSRMPHLVDTACGIGNSTSAEHRGGPYTGIGLPVATGSGTQVMLILSAHDTPFFRASEIWQLHPDGLALWQYSYTQTPHLAAATNTGLAADDIAHTVRSTGQPLVVDDLAAIEPRRASIALEDGVTFAVGYPIYVADSLRAVVVLYC